MKNFDLKSDLELLIDYYEIEESDFAKDCGISYIQLNRILNNQEVITNDTYEKIYSYCYKEDLNLNTLKEKIFTLSKSYHVLLFHGSKGPIEGDIDLNHSKSSNDFGVGFYLGQTLEQAASWVAYCKEASIYCFYFDFFDLNIVQFEANRDWLYAVLYYRGAFKDIELTPMIKEIIQRIEEADVVIAPIADNQMYQVIDSFAKNEITDIATINCLCSHELGYQYVLKSNKALQKLKCIDCIYLCQKEKQQYLYLKNESFKTNKLKSKKILDMYRREGEYFDEMFKRI